MTQRTLLRLASLIIITLAFTSFAFAVVPQRTFVSAQHGDDANTANNCSVTLPCRNFNAAVGVVAAGGEVVALDSGGYGVTTISKAVTLTSPLGVYAAITAQSSSDAITVSAAGGSTGDTVVLRGLTLTGLGGNNGINVTSVGNLHVEGCVISGFNTLGIYVHLGADGSRIFVKDTIMRNNGNSGIYIKTFVGIVRASIDNCRSERNGNEGFFAANNSRVTINRSVASGNNSGFVASSDTSGEIAELSCQECVSSYNAYGFVANTSGGAATIRVSHSMATNNATNGFAQLSTGVFRSLGNNLVDGNATETSGTITLLMAK